MTSIFIPKKYNDIRDCFYKYINNYTTLSILLKLKQTHGYSTLIHNSDQRICKDVIDFCFKINKPINKFQVIRKCNISVMAGFSKYSFLKYLYHNYNDYWYNENNLNFIDNDEITIFYIKSYGYYAFIIKSYDKVLTNMFKLNCNKITI